MTQDERESLITQYLDGTIDPGRADEVRDLLAGDPEAKAFADEETKLTGVLRSWDVPGHDWNDLAADFAAVVTGTVDEAAKAQDQKLNAILRSAPAVPAVKWEALTAQISSRIDAELEVTDASDERLDAVLRNATPLPELNWDRLAGHLSDRVAEALEEAEAAQSKVYRISWTRSVVRYAVAAVVAVGAFVGWRVMNSPGPAQPSNPNSLVSIDKPAVVVVVQGPQQEKAVGSAVVDVQIGASSAFVSHPDEDRWRTPIVIAVPAGVPVDESGGGGWGFE